MRIRRLFIITAVVVVIAPLGIASNVPAQATTPYGPVAGVTVNGDSSTGTVPIEGSLTSGTMTYAGFTAACAAGSVDGTVDRGPNTAPKLRLSSLDLTCDSPLGDDAVISLDTSRAGCSTIDTTMADHRVRTGNAPGDVDSGSPTSDPGNVTGDGVVHSQCVAASVLASCTYRFDGSFDLQLDEAVKTVGGASYQDVILTGGGLTTRSPSNGCFGLVPNGGSVTLNNITFSVRVSSGTTTGIDVTGDPAGDPGGPVSGVRVNGFDTAGTRLVSGRFTSGTVEWPAAVGWGAPGYCGASSNGTSIGGTVNRGPRVIPAAPDLTITSLQFWCESPMDSARMGLADGCSLQMYFDDVHVHPGLIDTGARGGDPDSVDGYAQVPSSCIIVITDYCTFHIDGTFDVEFMEAPRTIGGDTYQELLLRSNGLNIRNPRGCSPLITNGASITLSELTFDMRLAGVVGSVVVPGTPPMGAIDFYH